MPAVPSNIYPVLMEVSRYLFAVLGVVALLAVLAWIASENRSRRERLRSLPAAGTIGELVVLSGGRELPPQTWFPVPREGVLGAFRSCDLVVPSPGVRARHLDFVWRDGVGLLIRPRSGCEVLVNDSLLDCHSDSAACPLNHGGLLRIGETILRLQVFKALDHTVADTVMNVADSPISAPAYQQAVPSSASVPDFVAAPIPIQPMPGPDMPVPVDSAFVSQPVVSPSAGSQSDTADRSPRRADRWKEDWGE